MWYEPRPEWAKASECYVYIGLLFMHCLVHDFFFSPLAATQSGDTLSSLSALQQEALYIPQSALSGLEPIGEGTHALIFHPPAI